MDAQVNSSQAMTQSRGIQNFTDADSQLTDLIGQACHTTHDALSRLFQGGMFYDNTNHTGLNLTNNIDHNLNIHLPENAPNFVPTLSSLGALSTHAMFATRQPSADESLGSEIPVPATKGKGSKRKTNGKEPKSLVRKKVKDEEEGIHRYDWIVHYRALCHYAQEHGHCQVPRSSVYSCEVPQSDEPNSALISYRGKLGRWLDDQRKARKKGQKTRMPQEKESLLQELVDQGKMLWDASGLKPNIINKQRGDHNWPRYYQALLKFGEINGHYNVPKTGNFQCDLPEYPDEHGNSTFDAKLGNWLYWQRELRRGRKGRSCTLDPEKEALLQALADDGKFNWDNSANNPILVSKQKSDEMWPKSYAALLKYGIEFGTYNVPDKRVYRCELEDGDIYEGNLGNWLAWQRSLKRGRKGGASLDPGREKMLQTLVDTGHLHWK